MGTTIGTYCSFKMTVFCPGWVWVQPNQDNKQSSKKNNKYQLLYPYSLPPDDGL